MEDNDARADERRADTARSCWYWAVKCSRRASCCCLTELSWSIDMLSILMPEEPASAALAELMVMVSMNSNGGWWRFRREAFWRFDGRRATWNNVNTSDEDRRHDGREGDGQTEPIAAQQSFIFQPPATADRNKKDGDGDGSPWRRLSIELLHLSTDFSASSQGHRLL